MVSGFGEGDGDDELHGVPSLHVAAGWSTGCRAIDEMTADVILATSSGGAVTNAPAANASTGRAASDYTDRTALRPLRPLTILEIAGPPGAGKTCMAITLALSPWKLGVGGAATEAEVLFVGKVSSRALPKWSHRD